MDDADQGMEASAATIRDRVRRQNAVTLNHQQAVYTKKLRPSRDRMTTGNPSLNLPVPLSLRLSVSPSLRLSVSLSLCLSVSATTESSPYMSQYYRGSHHR